MRRCWQPGKNACNENRKLIQNQPPVWRKGIRQAGAAFLLLLAAEMNCSGALQSGSWIRIGSEANGEIWFSWSRYPLSCIHAEYGKMVLLLLIVLLAAMLYSLLRIKWENPCLGNCVWYISAVLIVNAVFAAGQEVFLIGTGVGLGNSVPLLGYGGWMFGIIWGLLDMKGGEVRSGIFDEADRKAV